MRKVQIIFVLLLTYITALSQNYIPFSATGKYTWIYNADSLYNISIDSTSFTGTDTTYWMNTIANPFLDSNYCWIVPYFVPAYYKGEANILGRKMIHSGSEFLFVNNGDTIFLRPFASGVWKFMSDSTLTASVSGTYLHSFQGVQDSVIEISISDGNRILLSKDYGLAETVNFSYYFSTDPIKTYVLFSIEGDTNFVQIPAFREIFDFEVGDEFHYQVSGSYTAATKIRHKVLSKSVSPGGDQFTYTIDRERLDYFNFYRRDTIIQVYDMNSGDGQIFTLPEFGDIRYNNDTNAVYLRKNTFINSTWHDRVVVDFDLLFDVPSCGGSYIWTKPQLYQAQSYAEGLGLIYDKYEQINGSRVILNLVYYKKGSDSAGTKHTFVTLDEPADAVQFELYPNPAGNELNLQGKLSGAIAIELYGISGQLVHRKEVSRIDGTFQLDLSMVNQGMYFLLIRESGNVVFRRKVVRVSSDF